MASQTDFQDAVRRLELVLNAEVRVSLEVERIDVPLLVGGSRMTWRPGRMRCCLEIVRHLADWNTMHELSAPVLDGDDAYAMLRALTRYVADGGSVQRFTWNGTQRDPVQLAGPRKRWRGYA